MILQSTRTTSHSNAFIDNIFSNIDLGIISDNLTAIILDHLLQFTIIPNIFRNTTGNRSNVYEKDQCKFDQGNVILDYFSIDWEDLFKIGYQILIIQSKYAQKRLMCC